MKSLVDIINESQGAELLKRTGDRFFGDALSKSRDLKNTISKSKKIFKDIFEKELTSDEVKIMETLINNPQYDYDKRSHVTFLHQYIDIAGCEGDYYHCEFNLSANNMPKSISGIFDDHNLRRNLPKDKRIYCRSYSSTFGTTTHITLNYFDSDIEYLVKFIKMVLKTIEPIKDDILNFHDEYQDNNDGIRRRQGR